MVLKVGNNVDVVVVEIGPVVVVVKFVEMVNIVVDVVGEGMGVVVFGVLSWTHWSKNVTDTSMGRVNMIMNGRVQATRVTIVTETCCLFQLP